MRWQQIIISPPAKTPSCNSCKTHSTRNYGRSCPVALPRAVVNLCPRTAPAHQQALCNGRFRLQEQLPRNLATVLTPLLAKSVPTPAPTLPVLREGALILAAADGTVTVANGLDSWGGSYGYYTQIDHDGGLEALYAHCSSICVATGQQVQAVPMRSVPAMADDGTGGQALHPGHRHLGLGLQ